LSALVFQERIRHLLRSVASASARFFSGGLDAFFLPSLGPVELISLGLILWTIWHGAVLSLAPPTDGDSLAYHLALVQDYLREGRIYDHPGNLWATFPGNLEMQYLVALLLGKESLTQLVPWVFSVMTPAAIAL